MGTYVFFGLGAPDGLRSRFLADVADLERWMRGLEEEFPGEYPPNMLAKVAEISLRGPDALKVSDPEEGRLIDLITLQYWNFCDVTGRHSEKDITPSAHKLHRYAPDLALVLPTAAEDICNYYRRLFAGNSLAECAGHIYQPVDIVFSWSWLLPDEVADFYGKLQKFAALLESDGDWPEGVFWVLEALRHANDKRSSLLISIA